MTDVLVLPAQVNSETFLITYSNSLTPWNNGTKSVGGASKNFQLNAAILELGPCTYRQLHTHVLADELFTLVKGNINSVIMTPNNTAISSNLTAGMVIVYPQGWPHFQYNPTCESAMSVVAFNAASIGTFNVIQNLVKTPASYTDDALSCLGDSKGTWATDPACLAACAGGM
jgi:oxalate decarboxylase/phosphoglucose isomerase-like protein (cupin superfamily)